MLRIKVAARLCCVTVLASSQAAIAQGVLRYAEDRAPPIINPIFTTTMSEARINELVFDGLYTDDVSLRSTPRLAQRAKIAADRLSMEITLRDDVKWHDGAPFTSADVVFTIQALRDKSTASSEAGRASWIATAEALDPKTVKLTFTQPEIAPQDKLHFKIVPAHAFNGVPVRRSDTFRAKPIGTGPWALASFNPDSSVTLSRSADSWTKAGLGELVMREVADKNYQAKLIVYDSLEALVRVLPRDLATLQNARGVELVPYQTNSWWYLGFNHAQSDLASPKVREALSLLVDVPALLAPVGTGALITGPFVPSSPFYNHEVAAPKRDPERAAQLLTEVGFTFNGRKWVGRNGVDLTFRVSTLSQLETSQDVIINLQAQLQQHGITVQPEFLGPAEWKTRVWSERAFDIVLSQWSFDRNEDIWEQFHSDGARNFVGLKDAEVDKLLDEARTTTDPQAKKALLRQVHARVAELRPMIFLWTLDSYAAVSTRVKDVSIHPFYFFTWADRWSMR